MHVVEDDDGGDDVAGMVADVVVVVDDYEGNVVVVVVGDYDGNDSDGAAVLDACSAISNLVAYLNQNGNVFVRSHPFDYCWQSHHLLLHHRCYLNQIHPNCCEVKWWNWN